MQNAERYTIYGHITIEIRHYETGFLEFVIIDTGRGIRPEDMKKVFKLFGQKDDVNETGTGLGLTLSKRIVDTLEGRMEIES
jgi:signal transduction histidine kinase